MFIQHYKDGIISKDNQGRYSYVVKDHKRGTYDSVADLVKAEGAKNEETTKTTARKRRTVAKKNTKTDVSEKTDTKD